MLCLGLDLRCPIDAGEKIVETLKALCEGMRSAAASSAALAPSVRPRSDHFDPAANDYGWTVLSGPYEIVALHGNITTVDGKPFIHAHIALGDNTFSVRGGHLKEAVVSVTCEVTLTRFRDDIGRTKDEATGFLKLGLERAKIDRCRVLVTWLLPQAAISSFFMMGRS